MCVCVCFMHACASSDLREDLDIIFINLRIVCEGEGPHKIIPLEKLRLF